MSLAQGILKLLLSGKPLLSYTTGIRRTIRRSSHSRIACKHLLVKREIGTVRVLGIFESSVRITDTLRLFNQIIEMVLERSHLLNFLVFSRLEHWELALLEFVVLEASIFSNPLAFISLHDYVNGIFRIR